MEEIRMLLQDKVAIVTGIGPAMGRSIALAYAREGAKLVLAARRDDRLQAVRDEVEAAGAEVLAVPTDITNREACKRLVDQTLDRFGHVDILVQNGHYDGDYKIVADSDLDDWRAIMEVNLFGALHLVQLVAPSMRARGDGRIVLINTGASTDPPATLGAYAASKAALASLVRTIAVELGPEGIRANGVQLGSVQGENWSGWVQSGSAEAGMTPEAFEAEQWKDIPLRGIPTADDCAGAVVFLASDLARPITGQSLAVNNGSWFVS
jgi:NAD(P)-dependent dehydrogenase (short-subunit alcohol dehydrogenase family)